MTDYQISNESAYLYLDQLSPAEVFHLLSAGAEVMQGKHLEAVSIVFPAGVPYKYVSLQVPDFRSVEAKKSDPGKLAVYERLVDLFREISGREPLVNRPFGTDDSRPLLEGAAWLLLNSAHEAGEKTAQEKDEFLVDAGVVSVQEAETIFKNVSFHATSTRVSSVEPPGGTSTADGAGRYFFHLKDDHKRKSSFMSYSASQLEDKGGYSVLQAYQSEGLTTFLPAGSKPGENILRYFTRLLENAPAVFGSREIDSTGLLAAIIQRQIPGPQGGEPSVKLEFLYLGALRFFKQEEFTRRKVRRASFSYLQLNESRSNLERLGQVVEEAGPAVGYRLELRSTRYLERNDLEQLNAQKAKIDYNLAYLQSIRKPRPILLRFTRQQLPALAAEIRSFPMKVIRDGSIRYGFQATQEEPLGYHFLLVDPLHASQLELDPLLLWRDIHAPHMKFWLDPFWSRYYFDGGGEALVFVPEGCSLFPPIHDWERGNMDYHLRETLGKWFQPDLQGHPIPNKPIYVFDGQPRPDEPIKILMLDQDAMAPLYTKLTWINDNLIIQHLLDNDPRIAAMAEDITWGKLAEIIKGHQEHVQRDFTDTALAAGKYMADTTNALTYVLTNKIDKIVKDTFRMTEKIRHIDKSLRDWEEVLSQMEEMVNQIRREKQDVTHKVAGTQNEFWKLEQQIQNEIIGAEKRRKEMELKVQEEIKKMRTTSAQLRARLKSLKL